MANARVFILAAGRGERLRPLSDIIPKPLLPVTGRPVLEMVLERALTISSKIGVNLHYKKDEIEKWVSESRFKDIALFPEDPVLGTGGALWNAREFLKHGPFIVHNSDIISDIDLNRLLEAHMSSGNIATLAVHSHSKFNSLALDDSGHLKYISPGGGGLAFTGIAAYSPELLEYLPEGASSVTDAWLLAINGGGRIGTLNVGGSYWRDIGTPSQYAAAVFDSLRHDGETVYVKGPQVCEEAEIEGFVAIEDGTVGKAYIRNCIFLKGGFAAHGERYENSILAGGASIDFDEDEALGHEQDGVPIGSGGSDRKYYRVRDKGKTKVFLKCSRVDPEFERQVQYVDAFGSCGVPVPELIRADTATASAEFEDLGDITLYSLLKCRKSEERIEELYREALDALIKIHLIPTPHAPKLLRERVFDYEHLRWETGYFMEMFVKGARGIRPEDPEALGEEFHRLALLADSFPKTVIHRDYQSQNIMINGGKARVIDYQGARVGPPAYDVASLLWDPYVRLACGMRDRLLELYISRMSGLDAGFDSSAFRQSLLPCRLQRHMQALGAYGFLGLAKAKRHFLKHIPEGVRLLKEDFLHTEGAYPFAERLAARL